MNSTNICEEKQPLTDAYLEKMNRYWNASRQPACARLSGNTSIWNRMHFYTLVTNILKNHETLTKNHPFTLLVPVNCPPPPSAGQTRLRPLR